MIRKTVTILSLIGLRPSVGLWGVSYFDGTCHYAPGKSYSLRGGRLEWRNYNIKRPGFQEITSVYYWTWGGFKDFSTTWRPALFHKYGGFVLHLPFWIPILVLGSTAWCSYAPLRRRKRKKLGLCVKCGYDLRASKDRCPECGEEFDSTGVGR